MHDLQLSINHSISRSGGGVHTGLRRMGRRRGRGTGCGVEASQQIAPPLEASLHTDCMTHRLAPCHYQHKQYVRHTHTHTMQCYKSKQDKPTHTQKKGLA